VSEKSVAQKLGLTSGRTLRLQRAPAGIEAMLGPIPEGASVAASGKGPFPLILLFTEDRATLVKELPPAKAKLAPGGALWVAYYKGTSGKMTDINRDRIHAYVPTLGLTTVAQIALDADWSAMRLKVV
jgi:hypothetical protein